jgi:glycerol-1-phosphate dehydrogenase [NAD(P)+]
LASIKNSKGSVSLTAQSPIGVIADTDIIRNAPFKLLTSGCADIISNYTAIKDWKLAQRLQNEYYSESASALSLMTAKLVIKSADTIKEGLEESARLVVKLLFSSSMAISIAGSSRPASGSEHKFSHALDKIAPKACLHGEQCGVGTIMMMNLHGGDWKFIKSTLKDVNAPTNAYELGIDSDDIIEALRLAHTIRPERYTILGENGLSKDAAIFGECKWRNARTDENVFMEIERKSKLFPYSKKFHYMMFSKSGFSDTLADRVSKQGNLTLVAVDDMFDFMRFS